jgi:hypothetical protein
VKLIARGFQFGMGVPRGSQIKVYAIALLQTNG